jgi:hypothetical protein
MRLVLEKNGIKSTIIFKYDPKLETAEADFNGRIYYVSVKGKVSRSDFQKVVKHVAHQLEKKGFKVSPHYRLTPKRAPFQFIHQSTLGDMNLVKEIQRYYVERNRFSRFPRFILTGGI